MPSLTLFDLTDDLLNVIASYLPPTSRLRLATTGKRLFNAVWSTHAEAHIIHHYPLERRITFPLQVHLDRCVRTVPARSRQQHLTVAVNPHGTLIAVLPYDNVLRLVCPRRGCVVVTLPVHGCFANDVWDVVKGMRRPHPRPEQVVYADDAGLDVETTLEFSADGHMLVVASRECVRFFQISSAAKQKHHNTNPNKSLNYWSPSTASSLTWSIRAAGQIALEDALTLIRSRPTHHHNNYHHPHAPPPPPHHYNHPHPHPHPLPHHNQQPQDDNTEEQQSTGGAAQLSPDGSRLAWVVFIGTPAIVHVTLWKKCTATQEWLPDFSVEADRVWTRRWAALAWARPVFTPNSKYLLLVVNCAHKVTRVVNVDGEFHRTKLCRFALLRMDLEKGLDVEVERRTEWLDLAPDIYPRLLAEAFERSLQGCIVHDVGTPFAVPSSTTAYMSGGSGERHREEHLEEENYRRGENEEDEDEEDEHEDGERRMTKERRNGEEEKVVLENVTKLMRMPGLAFNSVHSCPAEATYKALSFGEASHPWFVSKQPMFSFHFSPSGRRVVLAPSPHSNVVRTLVLDRGQPSSAAVSAPSSVNHSPLAATASQPPSYSSVSVMDEKSGGGGRKRRTVFKCMPWREAFATVTAFSSSGQWLAGASLLEDDGCCVCVRNVTVNEYFGEFAKQ